MHMSVAVKISLSGPNKNNNYTKQSITGYSVHVCIPALTLSRACLMHASIPGVHLGINLRGGKVELALPQGGHNFHTELR